MSIPTAVQEQGQLADEAMEALEREMQDTASQGVTLDDLGLGDDDQTPDSSTEEQSTVDEEIVEETPESEPAPERSVDFKHKYDTLLGKYNAEVARLRQERDSAQGQVEILAQLPSITAATPGETAPTAEEIADFRRYLKEDEREDMGEDLLDMHARLAKGVVEGELQTRFDELVSRLDRLETSTTGQQIETFWDRVEAQVAGARTINHDPTFHSFLDGVEPLSGQPYRHLGEAAVAAGDVNRMVHLLDQYQIAYGSPSTGGEGPAPKAKPQVKPEQVRSRRVDTGSSEKPLIKESAVKQFFNDVARGRYAGKEELRDRREAEIDAAMNEGRIIPG